MPGACACQADPVPRGDVRRKGRGCWEDSSWYLGSVAHGRASLHGSESSRSEFCASTRAGRATSDRMGPIFHGTLSKASGICLCVERRRSSQPATTPLFLVNALHQASQLSLSPQRALTGQPKPMLPDLHHGSGSHTGPAASLPVGFLFSSSLPPALSPGRSAHGVTQTDCWKRIELFPMDL